MNFGASDHGYHRYKLKHHHAAAELGSRRRKGEWRTI